MFYTLYDTLVKKHFEIYSTDPYHLMFLVGLFNFILIAPLDLLVYFFDENGEIIGLDIIYQIKFLYKSTFFLPLILEIISAFLWIGGIILTLYYFTPCHFIISLTFAQFLSQCIGWIKNKENNEWYSILINVFLYVIIFFSSLIYNEVIVIHLWSIEKFTDEYITSRGRNETISSLNYYEQHLNEPNESFTDSFYSEVEQIG